MATYSVNNLIGKNFIAKKRVPLLRSIESKKPFLIVEPGNNIGTLYSWVEKYGNLYFMFYDKNKKPYYVKHIPSSGMIEVSNLIAQGVKSDEEILKENIEKSLPNLERYVKKYALPFAVFLSLLFFIKK